LNWIVHPKYSWITFEREAVYVVHTYQGIGIIDKTGRIVADAKYRKWIFCDEKIILQDDDTDMFGTINYEGKIIDPFIYSKIECIGGKLIKTPNKKQE